MGVVSIGCGVGVLTRQSSLSNIVGFSPFASAGDRNTAAYNLPGVVSSSSVCDVVCGDWNTLVDGVCGVSLSWSDRCSVGLLVGNSRVNSVGGSIARLSLGARNNLSVVTRHSFSFEGLVGVVHDLPVFYNMYLSTGMYSYLTCFLGTCTYSIVF